MDPNANIIFGALVDESMEGEIAITVIATGFPLGKAEAEEKLAQASGKSVRTISDAMRAAEAKQSSSSSLQSAQQAQPQPAHRRVATHAKKAETAPEESAEDASPRSRQRIGASESLEKASEPTTHTHTHTPSHAQVSAAGCGVRRLGETTSPTAAGPVLTTVVCCVSQKSSRIVSTEDADLPDFLSRLRRNR